MRIVVPRLSTKNALTFCETLKNCDADEKYIFDFSGANHYEPMSMILTSAAIRQFRKDRNLSASDIGFIPSGKQFDYACYMGYFGAAGFDVNNPGKRPSSKLCIPITCVDISELQREAHKNGDYLERGDIIENYAKGLAAVLAPNNRELKSAMQYLLREAIRNIPEHSGSDKVWLCGQYIESKKSAEIAISDNGIGIYSSLKRNSTHREYITTNEEALHWALKPGVSVAFNPARGQKSQEVWANSGYGLYMISEICRMTSGLFTFASGGEALMVSPLRTELRKTDFKGTALGIRIGANKFDDYQHLLNTARTSGEATAKTIKNSFRKASIPSRGLIRK